MRLLDRITVEVEPASTMDDGYIRFRFTVRSMGKVHTYTKEYRLAFFEPMFDRIGRGAMEALKEAILDAQ